MIAEDKKSKVRARVEKDGLDGLWTFVRSQVLLGSKEKTRMVVDFMDYGVEVCKETQNNKSDSAIENKINDFDNIIKNKGGSIEVHLEKINGALDKIYEVMKQPQSISSSTAYPQAVPSNTAYPQTTFGLASYSGIVILSNPATGEVQKFTSSTTMWSFFFGSSQLMYHRVWGLAFATIFFPPICIFKNKKFIIDHYLKMGFQRT